MEEKIEIIQDFITAKDGRATYKSWLLKYFETVGYLEYDETKKYIVVKDINNYFNDGRNYDDDIITFTDKIEHWAPQTKKSAVSCVKNFFMLNDVAIRPKTQYQLRERCKGSRAISKEKVPTITELKSILSFGTVKHRAVFLTMLSGGLRPNEVVSITFDDVYLDETPGRIEIPHDITKTDETRTTFFSSEAKHYLKQWFKIRDSYLKTALTKSTLHEKINDNRIFPFSGSNLRDMWNNLITKAGFDERDKKNGKGRRHLMTPHKLRKRFKSQLSNASVPFEIVEALMGHEEGISAVYRRYSPDQLKQWYLKGEPSLLIFEAPQNQEIIDNMKDRLDLLAQEFEKFRDFENRTTSIELRDANGDVVLDDELNPVTVVGHIPQKVVQTEYEEEEKRKFNKLVETLGDEELAKKVWNLKSS